MDGATLTPFVGAGYQSAAGEAKREAVNAWIRRGAFDGVIDFAQATRDHQAPKWYLATYNSGDHLHPSNAGYVAMGTAAAKVLAAAQPDTVSRR